MSYPLPRRYKPVNWQLSTTETGAEALTASDATVPLHIREDATDENANINAYLKAARIAVETMTNRFIVQRTCVLKMDRFPDGDEQYFELPGGNIQSVTSIAYTDTDNQAQTFTGFTAELGTDSTTAKVFLSYDQTWPTDVRTEGLPVVVTYTAGYDPSASPAISIPEPLLQGIRMVAADMFEVREASAPSDYVPNFILNLILAPYKIWNIA